MVLPFRPGYQPPKDPPKDAPLERSTNRPAHFMHIETRRQYLARQKAELARIAAAEARYGLPAGAYAEMLERQQFRCFACNRHQDEFKRSLAIDHCHRTGKVRRLLCGNCNQALGHARDDPRLLRLLALYVEFHAARE